MTERGDKMPTGIRFSVYVRNRAEYEELKRTARDDGRSVSNYLIWLHEVNIGKASLGRRSTAREPKKLYK